VFPEHLHSLVRSRRDPLYMGPHASAHVKEQQNVNRHILAIEIADLLNLSGFTKDEIFRMQARNGAVIAVDYLDVHAHQRHIATEHGLIFGRRGLSAKQASNRHYEQDPG
jgi:hypothetical protein